MIGFWGSCGCFGAAQCSLERGKQQPCSCVVQALASSYETVWSASMRRCEWKLILTVRNGVCSHGETTQLVGVDAVGTYNWGCYCGVCNKHVTVVLESWPWRKD